MSDHVILVAFTVHVDDDMLPLSSDEGLARRAAHEVVLRDLDDLRVRSLHHTHTTTSWWVAEDDRTDGSDNDSAVFVHPGHQHGAVRVLKSQGHTGQWNQCQGTYGNRFA